MRAKRPPNDVEVAVRAARCSRSEFGGAPIETRNNAQQTHQRQSGSRHQHGISSSVMESTLSDTVRNDFRGSEPRKVGPK